MASRKITRSAKKTSVPKVKAVTKAAATKRPAAKDAVASKRAGKAPPASTVKPTPSRKASENLPPMSAANYLPSGLDALLRRLRVRDQAAAKKLEPGISHLAKAYGKLLGKG